MAISDKFSCAQILLLLCLIAGFSLLYYEFEKTSRGQKAELTFLEFDIIVEGVLILPTFYDQMRLI